MSTLNSILKGELGWRNNNLSVLKLDGIEYRDLRFPNEESYRGGWKDSKPEGEGCYTWADGSTYEGAWHAGLKHGWGKYRWPNGACYQGEWRDGFMQGYGTFESPDGARYAGNWQGNLKHGIGKKVYANGDAYEGLWRNGKAEGPGRYVWHNGNQYDGEWRGGKMHGQGTLKWITGERYDGEWGEGQEEGIGVFTWRDGCTYEGFWQAGKKTGAGVFRPAPTGGATGGPSSDPSVRVRPAPADSSVDAAAVAAAAAGDAGGSPRPRSPVGSPLAADAPLDSPSAGAMHRRDRQLSPARVEVPARDSGAGAGAGAAELVFVCQYDNGKLMHEEALSTLDLELIFGPGKHSLERKRRLRRGRKRQVRLGETIYKGHRSYDLMLNLQLGIRYTITTLNKLPAPAQLTEEHYEEKVWLRFPREGSEVTPPHPSNDFKWKDYCTTAFKRLRDLFGIDHSQYILSICGDQALREMASPGKSGSVFFISHDDQFMIKTMHKEEIKLLLSMMLKYVRHAEANPETLLTRFYGVHRVKPSHGRKVRFVVMNNVFRTDLDLHRKYDLKGSTYGRTAGPRPSSAAICKDLDLDVCFKVDPKLQARVAAQLAADAAFLEEIRVMDYSMLLGVHRRHLGETSASPLNTDKEDDDAYLSAEEAAGLDEAEGSDEGSEEEEGEGSYAFHPASSASLLPPTSSGSLLPATSSGSFAGPPAALRQAADSRRARRSSSGLAVAPTPDTDADVMRSVHSMTVEQQAQQLSPRPESRSPSFLLKGAWRSFTAGSGQRRGSQPQLAPALGQQPGQTQQPPASAQITPRVQPSILPTPRMAAAAPVPQLLPNGSSRLQPPAAASPGIGAALRAAAAFEADAGGEAAADAAPAQPAMNGEAGGRRQAKARQAEPRLEQQLAQQLAQQLRLEEGQEAAAGEQLDPLPTWRSDAVQLPEQFLLPDGIPVSPTASLDTTGSMHRGRGSAAPALGSILEQPGSGREQEQEEEPQAGEERQRQGEAAQAAAADAAAGAGGGGEPGSASESTPQPGAPAYHPHRAPFGGSTASPQPPLVAAAAAVDASPASSLASSAATMPTSAFASAAAPRGLPLPGGVPRIALQAVPQPSLQPAGESNDWMEYAQSVSDAGLSGHGSDLRSSSRRQRSATPDSDAASTPISSYRRHTTPLPAGGGIVDVSRLLQQGGSPSPPVAPSGRGPASAPATSRPPAAVSTGGSGGGAVHRLAHAAGPEPPPPPSGSATARPAAADSASEAPSPDQPTPASGGSRGRDGTGLARTASAPAGALLAAATVEGQRRHLAHHRGMSMVVGREASVVDLASPEAAAVAGRITTRLPRKVTDQLVQDLVKLARYRMVGAISHSPSARQSRVPTTVLAARHMRRSSGGASPHAHHHHHSSQDEAGAVTPGGPGAGPGEEAAPPPRLGMGMPAVAVSQQAGQGPEEVVLFFGIIDFLQEYNMRKMLEHSFKAVVQDAKGISVVEPRAYAKRFLKFMDRVFPPPGSSGSNA